MRKIMTVVLASAVVFSMMPGLVASATDPDPATPLWGGGPVSEEPNYEISPRVDGGIVVWADQDAGSLHYRTVQSGISAVVYDEGFSRDPDIAGDLVVWTEFATDADGDVWMKDLGGGLPSEVATSTELDEIRPRTDGDVIAWLEGTDLDGYHVAGTVLSTGVGFQLDSVPGEADSVDVADGLVALSAGGDVYIYDVAADEISDPLNTGGPADAVAIDGDVVVWSDDRSGNRDIYGYDLGTASEFAVCTDPSGQYLPAVSGGLVVWEDDRNGESADVGAYDRDTGMQYLVTDDADFAHISPHTDGSHIVWVDNRNGDVSGEDIWWIGYDTVAPTTTSDLQPSYLGSATITLAAEDNEFGSGVDTTWYKINYVGDWYAGPVTFTRPGKSIPFHFKSYDKVGNLEAYNVEYFDLVSVDTTYTEIAGPNRYDTAVATSEKTFPKGTQRVIITTGENWPDALGGAALAKAKKASVLLTLPSALPESVLEEIDRLNATEAIILGGYNAVSEQVEATLEDKLGADKVTRIEGGDRYETADLVARATRDAMGYSPTKVLVATGENFPDALGASPLAALGPWPLVLAPPDSGLTQGTKDTITYIGAKYGVILGGESAVSTTAEDELKVMLTEDKVQRLSGKDRYETSIECAKFGVSHGLWWDGVAISTGANFPDALAAGMLQGQAGSVLLLTPSDALHGSVAAELTAQRDWIGNVTFLGGTAAVSQDVRAAVAAILK